MELFPSLVLERFGKERWEYRLEGISKKDVKEMYKRLDEVLDSKGRSVGGSDVDWEAVVRVIMKRYGERLEVLRYILRGKDESEEQERNYTAIIVETQKHATTMLTPYITRDDVTPQVQNDTNLLSWAVPVFEKCATAYVDSLRTSFYARMTRSEQLIFNSIRDTVKEICRVLVRVWAESSAFKQPVLDGSNSHQHRASGLKELVNRWEKDISGLMQWLAWDIWTNCRPACGFEVKKKNLYISLPVIFLKKKFYRKYAIFQDGRSFMGTLNYLRPSGIRITLPRVHLKHMDYQNHSAFVDCRRIN